MDEFVSLRGRREERGGVPGAAGAWRLRVRDPRPRTRAVLGVALAARTGQAPRRTRRAFASCEEPPGSSWKTTFVESHMCVSTPFCKRARETVGGRLGSRGSPEALVTGGPRRFVVTQL